MSGRAPVPAADKLFFEREMLSLGAEYVAGADEAGRGPLAGPVVCAAVILPLDRGALIDGIDDSKKLKAEERERLAALIRERALSYAVCEEDNETIDRINILEATKLCMKRAVEALSPEPDVVLIDGNFRIAVSLPQRRARTKRGAARWRGRSYARRSFCRWTGAPSSTASTTAKN